jgi:DNA replication protein DnaC
MALERVKISADELREMWATIERLGGRSREEVAAANDDEIIADPHKANFEHRVAMSRKLSNIPEQFVNATFDTYQFTEGNGLAWVAAERVIKSKFRVGLGVYGDPGVGKTHLAAIIANAAIAQGRMTIFTSVRRMLDTIKDSYSDDPEGHETELRLIKRFSSIDVLVLNDLGKEPLTKWSIEMLFAIMDDRWEQGRALILTTNLPHADLAARYRVDLPGLDESTGAAMMDRLAGMTGMPWQRIDGESRRWGV